jgi:hypothetical protein
MKITIDRAVVEQALEALKSDPNAVVEIAEGRWKLKRDLAITALKAALAEPQGPPYPGWKMGCQVCGAHGAVGFVCPRSDCPTRVTCGGC